jgi:hypothetical protein
MSSFKEQFEIPGRFRNISLALMAVGIVSVIVGFFMYGSHEPARFWATMLHNSVFFLLITNASMFFICATTLAMGSWQLAFRRVPEAISKCVIPLGIIALIVLLCIVLGDQHHIYHWLDKDAVQHDEILKGKSGFLSTKFFIIWTILSIGLWAVLGHKMRQMSRYLDENPLASVAEGRKYVFKSTIWSALFIVWFALTVASVTPWLWLMSIDAHWYSTMYSWYTFASSFVSGVSLIALFVIFLKNRGYLEVVTEEHLHDLGKFMFAFSIFWCYLWFSQYMLIWYANIPEETIYFKPRVQGVYKGIFFLNLIVNFLVPLLLLMRRSAKRNYTSVAILAVLIIFGHWVDFYQMVFVGPFKEHVDLNLFDFGVAAGFVGLIMFSTGRALAQAPLLAKNDPFFKESVIHHT